MWIVFPSDASVFTFLSVDSDAGFGDSKATGRLAMIGSSSAQ
jgi:hypothetical protein